MSSDKHCCVPRCKEIQKLGRRLVLHSFPNPEKERQRFNSWLYAIGGDILGLGNEHVYKYRRVCRSHFEMKHLCSNNRISKIAVPSLNMPDSNLHRQLFETTSTVSIEKDVMQKECIEIEQLHEQMPSTSNSSVIRNSVQQNLDKQILPAECKATADLLLFMDNIFDSVNGSYLKNKHTKPLLGPATPNSAHKKTWAEGIKTFQTMKFVTSVGREDTVPSVANWVWTLKGIEVLVKKLEKEFGVTSVWLRHLNQDPLENFFGAIRSHGCRNVNPTCDQFEAAFASLIINNLSSVQSPGKNCEGDFCDALYAHVIENNSGAPITCTANFDGILDIVFTPIEQKEKDPRVIGPLQYISGYFLKKVQTHVFKSCTKCKDDFSSNEEIEYLKYREYAGKRWLCTPSKDLIKFVSNVQDVADYIFKEKFDNVYIREIIITAIFVLVNSDFIKCVVHKKTATDYLIKFIIRFMIYNHCKNINKILAGRREVEDDKDTFQLRAKDYHKKHFKSKK